MFLSGMDPLVFCTLCGVASSAVGYMLGCALYGAVWQWMNKDLAHKMKEVRHFKHPLLTPVVLVMFAK